VYSKIGWRLSMEDAHISIPDFTDKKFGLFAVFDGHGGTVVSNI
jgi:serine/threonine protein phosphatase PrpC